MRHVTAYNEFDEQTKEESKEVVCLLERVKVDYHESREWGRIRVSQTLKLRTSSNQTYEAVAVDVSEENIGIETEAALVLGECIQLELESADRTIVVHAIVKRAFNNGYGCIFSGDDYGKVFSYYTNHSVVR